MFSFGIKKICIFGLGVIGAGLSIYLVSADKNVVAAAPDKPDLEFALPNKTWMKSDAEQIPIVFLNRSQNAAEWDKLASFWNESTQKVTDTVTGNSQTWLLLKSRCHLV